MRPPKAKHRVIVVEDDRTSRKLIARILEMAGYDVLECAEGKDALHIAEMNPPRAMIIDVMLPDMKGTKIVEELLYKDEFRFTKCLFLTGLLAKKSTKPSYYFEIQGERFRALPKPIRKGQLLRHLADYVTNSIEQEAAEKREKEDEKTEIRRLIEEKKAEAAKDREEAEEEIVLEPGLY